MSKESTVNKGLVTMTGFDLPPMNFADVYASLYKEVSYTDAYGMKKYTYIPTDVGLDEMGLKVSMLDVFETKAADVSEQYTEYATIKETTARDFERFITHFGTKLPKKFKRKTAYHELRFNESKAVGVIYQDGYEWKMREELDISAKCAIESAAKSHMNDYALIPALQFSHMLQDDSDEDYYPTQALCAFDDAVLINAVSGRLMPAADEATCAIAGNTVTGTMSTTPAAVTLKADVDNVLNAFGLMRHPENDALLMHPNVYSPKMKYICYVPGRLHSVFRDLLKTDLLPIANGPLRNPYFESTQFIIKDLPELVGSISDYSWYMQLYDPSRVDLKPAVELRSVTQRIPFVSTWGWDNDKEMFDKQARAVAYSDIVGYGAAVPHTIVKISNT